MLTFQDEHDRRLASLVCPPDFVNPVPKPRYDLAVIGAGTAGLVCAVGAAGLGARVALVERHRLGGDCLNSGCVPSKALLRSAHALGEARAARALGLVVSASADFPAVMAALRARRADLAPHDSAGRLSALGVDVFFGDAAFDGPASMIVRPNGAPASAVAVRFRKAVIATGSHPVVPPVAGLAESPFLTSDTLFERREQPQSMVVLGGGPVGCEMAQAFARLGTSVTLLESAPRLLPHEDPDASAAVERQLARDGVRVLPNAAASTVRHDGRRFEIVCDGRAMFAEALLVAAGRAPTTGGLNLEAAGVGQGPSGVVVDDRLRTANPRIFAAGDVCSRFRFTHAADAAARVVIQNALFHGRGRASELVVPWCTFTSPEVAHVGVSSARAADASMRTVTVPLQKIDRAVIDQAGEGFFRLHHERGRIRGATIVGPHAGEIIALVAVAMQHRLTLDAFASTIFPYPTYSMALRQAADAYRRGRLTPRIRTLLQYYFQAFR